MSHLNLVQSESFSSENQSDRVKLRFSRILSFDGRNGKKSQKCAKILLIKYNLLKNDKNNALME